MNDNMITIGEACESVVVGHVGSTSEYYTDNNGVPFLRTQNVGEGEVVSNDIKYVVQSFHDKLKKSQLSEGDVILSRVISDKIRCAIVPSELHGANCANIIVIKPGNKTDGKYLKYFINSPLAQNSVLKLKVGSAQSVINVKVVKAWSLPLPPLDQQKKIAAILDAADDYRQKTKALIAKYDELTQSLFLELFGDPVTNPMSWEVVKFSDVGKLDRGKSKHRPRNAPELLGGDHPLIQTGDLANCGIFLKSFKSTYSDIGLAQSKKWPAGTLCITIAANIAKTGILTFDACFPDSVVGFVPNEKTNNVYTLFWLSFLQKILEETAPESAQKNINLAILRALDFPLPEADLQNQFAQRVQAIEAQKTQAQESLAKAEDLFNSLLQKAFKGELT